MPQNFQLFFYHCKYWFTCRLVKTSALPFLCRWQMRMLYLLLQRHKTIGSFPHAVSSLHNSLCKIASLNLDRAPSNQCSYRHNSDVRATIGTEQYRIYRIQLYGEHLCCRKNQGRSRKPYKEAIESNARSKSKEIEERTFSTKALQTSMKTSKTYCRKWTKTSWNFGSVSIFPDCAFRLSEDPPQDPLMNCKIKSSSDPKNNGEWS